jgi:hypothetical protein
LAAAEANVSARPEDPNAYDTLAQVQAARDEADAAAASAQRGLELADDCSAIAQQLRQTLCDARLSRVPVALAGERRLAQDLVMVPGEDELFVTDDPYEVVRRALAGPVRELARECLADHVVNGAADQLVVLVRLGEEGRVARVDLFAPGVDEEGLRCLRERAGELSAPLDAPGLEVLLLESLALVER